MATECDFSWLDTSDRLLNAQQHNAKEPMPSILAHAIYVNSANTIVKVSSERIALTPGISEGRLLAAIQAHKAAAPDGSYKLSDLLLYHVNISPENIQQYAALDSEDEPECFLTVLPLCASGISIPDSVFIFHDINCLYMVYGSRPASILKSGKADQIRNRTRRVVFKALPLRRTRYASAPPTAESVEATTDALDDRTTDSSSGDARLSPEAVAGGASNTLFNASI